MRENEWESEGNFEKPNKDFGLFSGASWIAPLGWFNIQGFDLKEAVVLWISEFFSSFFVP